MSNIITATPANVTIVGKNTNERKVNLASTCGTYAAMALTAERGKVGKAAQARTSHHGMAGIIDACCNSAYRPLAEYLAGLTGESVIIKGRQHFECLDAQFEAALSTVRASKNGGRTSKGADNGKATGYVKAIATVQGVQAAVAAFHAERKAQRDAKLLETSAV